MITEARQKRNDKKDGRVNHMIWGQKERSGMICSSVDRNCDVAEARDFYHNIVLWPWCGTLPGARHRPSVFTEWAQLPCGQQTSSSIPLPLQQKPPSSSATTQAWSGRALPGASLPAGPTDATSRHLGREDRLPRDWLPAPPSHCLCGYSDYVLVVEVQVWTKEDPLHFRISFFL